MKMKFFQWMSSLRRQDGFAGVFPDIRCLHNYSYCGTITTISQDRVKPSPRPDSWKLPEIFATGIVIGTYLALVTVLFYWVVIDTDILERTFNVRSLSSNTVEVSSAVYLQVSIISQALIFVTCSQSWSFMERLGVLLMIAFVVAQLILSSSLFVMPCLEKHGISYSKEKTAFFKERLWNGRQSSAVDCIPEKSARIDGCKPGVQWKKIKIFFDC